MRLYGFAYDLVQLRLIGVQARRGVCSTAAGRPFSGRFFPTVHLSASVRHCPPWSAVVILSGQRRGNMCHMVDHGSVTALYVQLADLLAQKISTGEYAPGQRLPSADQLAQEHDIAANTARKALALLRSRGLAEMSPGRGTYVTRAR